MILTDFNQVAIANIMQFSGDLKKNQDNKSITNIARHAILSSLKFYKTKFQKEFGSEMVIACDSNNYWRKDIFLIIRPLVLSSVPNQIWIGELFLMLWTWCEKNLRKPSPITCCVFLALKLMILLQS